MAGVQLRRADRRAEDHQARESRTASARRPARCWSCVVLRRDLDHVAADEVEALEPAAAAPAPRAWSGRRLRACRCRARRPGRALSMSNETIDRAVAHHARAPGPRWPSHAERVDLLGVDHGHAGVVGELPQVLRRAADADLDRALGVEHAVEHGVAERAAVVELACRSKAPPVSQCASMWIMPTGRRVRRPPCRIGCVIEWSPPTESGATPAATTARSSASMSSWQSSRLKRLRNGTSPTSATRRSTTGAQPQHVVVRADPLDAAQRARAEARARPVGHAEIHRHADQAPPAGRRIPGRPGDQRHVRRGEQRRHAGIGRHARAVAGEDALGHRLEAGVECLAARRR